MLTKQTKSLDGVVIQKGLSNCGPASLLNVLRLKGETKYTEEELAELCNAREGFDTEDDDLLAAAEAVGLDIVESKEGGTAAVIERHLDNGAYVIICYTNAFSGNGHYSVVTAYDDQAFYLRDSSLGLLRLKKEWLDEFWYGASGSHQWFAAVK